MDNETGMQGIHRVSSWANDAPLVCLGDTDFASEDRWTHDRGLRRQKTAMLKFALLDTQAACACDSLAQRTEARMCTSSLTRSSCSSTAMAKLRVASSQHTRPPWALTNSAVCRSCGQPCTNASNQHRRSSQHIDLDINGCKVQLMHVMLPNKTGWRRGGHGNRSVVNSGCASADMQTAGA